MNERRRSPPDVRAWRDVEVLAPLAGGVRNPVYLARRGQERLVIRVSGRSPDSLAWELDLLDALDSAGLVVPRSVPTDDGRLHDRGVLVQRFIEGDRPVTRQDWSRVVATMSAVHEATAGWPQRPGFRSARELMRDQSGGDVDLGVMPPDAVALVRASWRAVLEADMVPGDYETWHRAGVAWEAATCWITEPEYARRRLDELRRLARS